MSRRVGAAVAASVVTALALTSCSGGGTTGTSGAAGGSTGAPVKGGTLANRARSADIISMDKTNDFQNESIWHIEQIMEPLYTVTPDGKSARALARHELHPVEGQQTYTFKLRPGVKFSNGKPMTSADVKFSIDDARKTGEGLGLHQRRDQEHHRPRSDHGRGQAQVPVGPVHRRHRAVRERHHPEQLRRPNRARSSTTTRSARARSCGTSGSVGPVGDAVRTRTTGRRASRYLNSVSRGRTSPTRTPGAAVAGRPDPDRRVADLVNSINALKTRPASTMTLSRPRELTTSP